MLYLRRQEVRSRLIVHFDGRHELMNPIHHFIRLDGESPLNGVNVEEEVQLVNVADLDSEVDAFAEQAFVRLQSKPISPSFPPPTGTEIPMPVPPRKTNRVAPELKAPPSARELLDLREALNKKDRDILALREALTERDREIVEAAERSLVIERAHADAEDRMAQLQELVDAQRVELGAKLEAARRTAEKAMALSEADRALLERAKEGLATLLVQMETAGAAAIDA